MTWPLCTFLSSLSLGCSYTQLLARFSPDGVQATSGPLHLLFPLQEMTFLLSCLMTCSFNSFKSLLKCYLFTETFPDCSPLLAASFFMALFRTEIACYASVSLVISSLAVLEQGLYSICPAYPAQRAEHGSFPCSQGAGCTCGLANSFCLLRPLFHFTLVASQ